MGDGFACAAVLAAPPAAARAETVNGQLAAVAGGPLVTVNADGTGLRTLWTPQSPGEITGVAWSPDGNRLAFSYSGRIVVFDVAARRGVTITDGDPTALNATTQADQPVDLPAATCTDPAGRSLTLVIVRPPDHGTLSGLGDVIALRLRLPTKPKTALNTVWITGTVASAGGLRRSVRLPVTVRR